MNNDNSDYTTNYHVPINKELLDSVVPSDHDIIYSTNLSIQYNIRNVNDLKGLKHPVTTGYLLGGVVGAAASALFNKIAKSMSSYRGNYYTDALITHEGIALNLPSFELNKSGNDVIMLPPNPQFVYWKEISLSKNGTFSVESVFNCQLNNIPEFEPEEKFLNRKQYFYEYITNLRSSYTAECLKNAYTFKDLNDNAKALEMIEKGFKSNVSQSESDYFDELNSLKAKIIKEETDHKLKMIDEIDGFLVKYFQSNVGKAFTPESLMKRLVEVLDNREWLEYLAMNIEGELNKLTFNGLVKSNQHQGVNFFFC